VDVTAIEEFKQSRPEVKVFNSNVCHTRIMWVWSRKPDDIEFTPEAELMVRRVSEFQTKKYHSSLPLVPPAEQSTKMAQMSVACAAKFVSTDDSFKKVIVRPEHVLQAHRFITTIYDHPSMGYDRYSDMMRKFDLIEPEDLEHVRKTLNMTDGMRNKLLTQEHFKDDTLQVIFGCNRDQSNILLSTMFNCNCIRRATFGGLFYKTPAFIRWLQSAKMPSKLFRIGDRGNGGDGLGGV
ncbi:MAG: hypothetical protein NTV01_00435, partial [Bacteroidia bacterium]|nr:hypothetical protein [Bacteroidia bacterium]